LVKTAALPLEEPLQEAPTEMPTLKDMVSVLLNPRPGEEGKVAEYKEALGNLRGNHRLGRMDVVLALAASMEPCEARDTELGRAFPDWIPLQRINDSWDIVRKVIKNDPKLLATFEKRCGWSIARDERHSVMTLRMFEAALFWDSAKSKFSTFLLDSRPLRRDIGHSKNQGSGVDADGLFYSEISTPDGEKPAGVSVRRIADSDIIEKIMHGSEGIEGSEKVRAMVLKALMKLESRFGNLLMMRYGVSADRIAELPDKVDWNMRPTTAARVQLELARTLEKFTKRGLETDIRNKAARDAADARKERLRRLASR